MVLSDLGVAVFFGFLHHSECSLLELRTAVPGRAHVDAVEYRTHKQVSADNGFTRASRPTISSMQRLIRFC